jgi:hypothetical protein
LYLLLTWAAADLCAGWRHRRVVLGGGATVILAALIFCARTQTAYWRNSESLWTHTLACTSDNYVAHNNLGNALLQKGRSGRSDRPLPKGAANQTRLRGSPQQPRQRPAPKGQRGRSDRHYQKALQIKPDYAEAHNNLGNALLQKGKRGRSDRPLPKGAANQTRLRGSPQQPRQRSAPKGQRGRSDRPLPKGAANQPDYARSPHNLGNASAPKGRGGRSDHPLPKGAANQSRHGNVSRAEVVEASHPDFGWSLKAAIESWSFSPAAAAELAERTYEHEFSPSNLPGGIIRLLAILRPGGTISSSRAQLSGSPQRVYSPGLSYPPEMLGKNQPGTAKIELIVDRSGLAQLPRILEASDPAFGWAAATWVGAMRFKQLTRDGQPTDLRVVVPIKFTPPATSSAFSD